METLGQRLARGDQASFAELYDLCAGRCHHYLVTLLGSRDAADEVLQETFLRLVRKRRSLARVENMEGYFFIVARNEAIRHAKRSGSASRKCRAVASLDLFIEAESDDACRRELAEVVTSALQGLTPEQREAVELKIYSGLTFREISELTGIPLPTAATRYRAGLERLRVWIARKLS
jgi:RNA polymerase sigma-70 factor (ECF subfamily)